MAHLTRHCGCPHPIIGAQYAPLGAPKAKWKLFRLDILMPLHLFFGPLFPPFFFLFVVSKSKRHRIILSKLFKMSPTSTRSSSISSASTSSSKNSEGVKKKFGCSFPNCGKSFSRSEHLHRHALNHKDGNNTCLRCSAHFRRRDLLGKLQWLQYHVPV
jgi:hypothetical protein